MYVLKGFANHALFANNTPGSTATIGEISNNSLTYTRELGQYVATSAPDVTLLTFLSAQDGTAQAVANDFKERTLTIVEWIYNLSLTESGQMYADQFLNSILAQFQTKAQNFACGAIVTDGTHYIPEWVSWEDEVLGAENYVKVWFSDASFASQYDEFTIVVVPPISPLDDFFKQGSAVEAEVNAVTFTQRMTNVQNAKGGYPETILRGLEYNYNDPTNSAHLVNTDWVVLIYGQAGNNIDSINDALAAYILANTSHSRDEWVGLFPDIFKRTEFVMVPLYDNVAISSNTARVAIYSPIANLQAALATLTEYVSTYPAAHINSHACLMAHPYQSLQIGVIGSIENRNNEYELTQVFPDFIAVNTASTDFNRMSQDTQGWAELISEMLPVAESMGPFTSLPEGMTRLTRNNQLFVVATYDNIHYLVAAKYNFSNITLPLPPITNGQ